MFVILTYDVASKRDNKVMKICRRYLTHSQRSVFEGVIGEGDFKSLQKELKAVVESEEDSICAYIFKSTYYSSKEEIGIKPVFNNIL